MDAEPGRLDYGVRMLTGAYIDMATRRTFGFGMVGPVPIDAIWDWADRHGLTQFETEVLEAIIFAVDAETMQRQRKPVNAGQQPGQK